MTMVTASTPKPQYRMARRLHSTNPGYVILRAVRARLVAQWYMTGDDMPWRTVLTTAIATIDLCISRVNSTLVV